MYEILYPILRAFIGYFVLLILSRLIGRKMISQMTFFDFAVGVMIGSAAANFSLGPYNSLPSGVAVLVTIALLVIILDFLHLKSFKLRKLINSEPVVAIRNGLLVNNNLKKERFTIDELMMKLREKNIFNIADVEFAILEYDGQVSVLPKAQKQPLTPSDINISPPYKGLSRDIIYDGKVMVENLNAANLDHVWLENQLKLQEIKDVKDVFYAGLDSAGVFYVSKRDKSEEKEGQYGIE